MPVDSDQTNGKNYNWQCNDIYIHIYIFVVFKQAVAMTCTTWLDVKERNTTQRSSTTRKGMFSSAPLTRAPDMDATSTGPPHLRRQWGENRAYNRTQDNK